MADLRKIVSFIVYYSPLFLLFYISLEVHFFFFAVAVLHVEW